MEVRSERHGLGERDVVERGLSEIYFSKQDALAKSVRQRVGMYIYRLLEFIRCCYVRVGMCMCKLPVRVCVPRVCGSELGCACALCLFAYVYVHASASSCSATVALINATECATHLQAAETSSASVSPPLLPSSSALLPANFSRPQCFRKHRVPSHGPKTREPQTSQDIGPMPCPKDLPAVSGSRDT